jgi:hypothetical protein
MPSVTIDFFRAPPPVPPTPLSPPRHPAHPSGVLSSPRHPAHPSGAQPHTSAPTPCTQPRNRLPRGPAPSTAHPPGPHQQSVCPISAPNPWCRVIPPPVWGQRAFSEGSLRRNPHHNTRDPVQHPTAGLPGRTGQDARQGHSRHGPMTQSGAVRTTVCDTGVFSRPIC